MEQVFAPPPQPVPATRSGGQKVVVDDLDALLKVLPPPVEKSLRAHPDLSTLLEVVLDLGRPPLARFATGDVILLPEEVREEDLQYVVSRISPFGDDNRAGIERTLHRISCIRNRQGKIVGLTCRVGRAVFGTVKIIEDLVFSGKSILLLGRPGVGKTTLLREVARVLADEAHKRVVVVDTSNEIAGDGDIPHPAIGRARRMQVKTPALQHAVMIEAVENHMPEVIIIDEMGTELEAVAARTIAERGVQLVATAHGNTLDNLILNPTLSDLVGGIQAVTLSDEEARRRGTQKTVLERKAPPTFDIVVEIQGWDQLAVHHDVAATVDALLRGYPAVPEVRWMDQDGSIRKAPGEPITLAPTGRTTLGAGGYPPAWRWRGPRPVEPAPRPAPPPTPFGTLLQREEAPLSLRMVKILPYGVNREHLLQVIREGGIGAEVTGSLQEADLVLTTKAHYRRKPDLLRRAEEEAKPIYVLRKNSVAQVRQFLASLAMGGTPSRDPIARALEEAEEGVQRVLNGEPSVELSPQSAFIRRLQHQLVERYNLATASTGKEPHRRVIIYRP